MILKETLREIVRLQLQELEFLSTGIPREQLDRIDFNNPLITIISGVRRSGKSTLLHQLMDKKECFYYFNFEDPRTINFEVTDFEKLNQVFEEEFGECPNYFFDEIQNVPQWERFVRRLHDAGKRIFITGSNASLLSRELGDRLTGRHLTFELFPFSYGEMLNLTRGKRSLNSFKDYLESGGFPEFLKYRNDQILHQLFQDIMARDIITRYQIRDQKVFTELAIFLITNVGKEFSYNRLKNRFGLGSTNTVIAYLSYLQDSYLLFTVPRFSYSYAKQRVFFRKVYSVDPGLSRANTASLSPDRGRLLENLVFLHLLKSGRKVFYYRNQSECDFLVKEKNKITQAIQVCYQLTEENLKREMIGVKEALENTKAKQAIIITLDQKDKIDSIPVVPAWEYIY
jgi:predicted AAA+ superfamily ATPase